MSRVSVSIVIPAVERQRDLQQSVDLISRFFKRAGLTHEILVAGPVLEPVSGATTLISPPGYGSAVRKATQEAKGSVILIADPTMPYPVSVLGDAVAMIHSELTDVVFGTSLTDQQRKGVAAAVLSLFLVPHLPDALVVLEAFSADAARVLFTEAKQNGPGFDLEIAFLANKYGFRIEQVPVPATKGNDDGRISMRRLLDAVRIRMANRQMAYRAARRCPVCYSTEVWTQAQVPQNIVRECHRCKSRYVARQWCEEELVQQTSVLELEAWGASPDARMRTSEKRAALLRRHVSAQSRVLEVGSGDAMFGEVVSREFEYVGIDASPVAARDARVRGVNVVSASLQQFVNTGAAFDAVMIFHVFECLPDPHDALSRVRELLKPGGVVFLTAFDTESLIYLMFEKERLADNFRTRLVLYSQSALVELFERSGFEIAAVGDDFEYRERRAVEGALRRLLPGVAWLLIPLLRLFPDPMQVSSGSIRIIARRRAGPPVIMQTIRSAEPTHAR